MNPAVRFATTEVRLESNVVPFHPTLVCQSEETPGVYQVTLALDAAQPQPVPEIRLRWDLPSVDLHHKWNPMCMQNRALDIAPGSYNHIDSAANMGMPVYSLYDLAGTNACTWALSDVIHDTRTGGIYRHGMTYQCEAVIRGDRIGVTNHYEITIRFDFRRVPYYEALRDVARYWDDLISFDAAHVPPAARAPLLSSWYLYRLDIDAADLERQCAIARSMGFGTVVLDDGWQSSQLTPGYQNNGDWEVCESKLPGFAEHVKRVQATGLKYLVWFSVPFVGIESRAYGRFMDMLLPGKEGANRFCLDPRFPETRAYLAETYEAFVTRYGVDGLKLDFIGTMREDPERPSAPDDRRDFVSIGEATCALLDDVMRRLRGIDPDILIEFRQAYTGPAMRKYATMFRAVDCPNSIADNRVRTLDLRLLSGDTAVHSDPIVWHPNEPVHSAAMQIIHALFSVPQISLRISELPEPHQRMLSHQMRFIREHEDVLQHGSLAPLHPHQLFPLVIASTEKKLLVACYADTVIRLDPADHELVLVVNGSYSPETVICLASGMGTVEIVIENCLGEVVASSNPLLDAGLHTLEIPPAGHAQLRRAR